MHIKSLTVRGFKTYKDVATVELDKHYNAIVGLNGSGKSNLLAALQFIVSEIQGVGFDRNALLHEGASTKVLSAYVEVVFDNTDRRLGMFDRDTVTIKRSFGHKKDEFLLDGKVTSKSEFQNIMESAGFNKTNPYYIVRQGKVMELTTMTDASRLKLLKEIAGTRVYDERRQESSKTLEDTKERKLEIDRILSLINARIAELTDDQKELKEMQHLERQKTCLEYVMNDASWREANEAALKYETTYRDAVIASQAVDDEKQAKVAQSQKVEAEIAELDLDLKQKQQQISGIDETIAEIRKDKNGTRLESHSLQRDMETAQKEASRKRQLLTKLKEKLKSLETEESRLAPALESAEKRLSENQGLRRKTEQEMTSLFAKQNRAKQYKSKKERDSALSAEIVQLERLATSRKKAIEEADKKISELQAESALRSREIASLESSAGRPETKLGEMAKEIATVNDNLAKAAESRRAIQGQLAENESKQDKMQDEIRNRLRSVYDRMNNESRGATAANTWARENRAEEKVYGTLLENIDVEEDYQLAVEVAAEKQLFSFVVENQDVAAQIIAYIKRRREGKITVTPLADIRPRTFNYPKNDDRVVPLVDCIGFPPHLRPAVESVFARFLLCENLDVCREFAGQGFDCITIEGDKVTRKGTVSGGYSGPNTARVRLMSQYKKSKAELEELQKRHRELEAQLAETQSNADNMYESVVKLQAERTRLKHDHETSVRCLHELKTLESVSREKVQQLQTDRVAFEGDREIHQEQILRLRSEVVSVNLGDLTEDEERRLREINEESRQLQVRGDELLAEVVAARNALDNHNTSVKETLIPQIQQLEVELSTPLAEENAEKVQELEAVEAHLTKRLETVESERNAVEAQKSQIADSLDTLRQEQGKLGTAVAELQKRISSLDKEATSSKQKMDDALRRKEEADRNRLALPGVSSDLTAYEEMSTSRLTRELAAVAGKLRAFKNVNKKALDQYTNFLDEQTRLTERREELDKSEAAIVELMESLDTQKDDTLLRTFENVNKHFGKVFAELVPNGKAKLILKKEKPGDVKMRGGDDVAEPLAAAEAGQQLVAGASAASVGGNSKLAMYSGVATKVSFTGQDNAFFTMQQLSGGQKTVVALSLIFALQQCDPAPFYLFDEIDAALDDQYRGAVAHLCANNSRSSQLIMTTFRSQLLEPAAKYFKVTGRNRCSSVKEVSREDALATIQEQQSLEGA